MRAAEFAQRVAQARRRGEHYTAQCPAHPDRTPSLTFRDGRAGVLLYCWAGCSVEAIARAAGVAVAELFFAHGHDRPPGGPRRVAEPLSPAQEWRRIWVDTLCEATSAGRFHAVWDPIFARADFVRHATRQADVLRARATSMSADDPAMWEVAALALSFEEEARVVEAEADRLMAAAMGRGRI